MNQVFFTHDIMNGYKNFFMDWGGEVEKEAKDYFLKIRRIGSVHYYYLHKFL